ncbi:uncharacterized membrane protein YhaH (DUF805 family) [Lewinella aquimaris]|uniref:Uncharacterized membrane protein YhaH (DUF805 family) n=1 Tax=Neolewinella aquimaris TaxID=1835722 RepID=A0A840E5E2_9BACT|nr:hypothetical protein [Neolewinella aquimaris]MBB4079173.1 uncharacterized membrane protein YhaH (DUF805 family) [Neolewinella aquimaris]
MPTPPRPSPGIYAEDLYNPRRYISREYFPAFALLLLITPALIFFGVPTLLAILANLRRHGDGLLFGHPPITFASYLYPWFYLAYVYLVITVCVNRVRAAGRSLWVLLVPGYNAYVLFTGADRIGENGE